jgi:hypothetical protein
MTDHYEQQNKEMLSAIKKYPHLVNFVKRFGDVEGGFMFSTAPEVMEIMGLPEVEKAGHSGCSAACALRYCEYMLNQEAVVPTAWEENPVAST